MRLARTVLAALMTLMLALAPAMVASASGAPAPAVSAGCEHHPHGHALPAKTLPAADHCAGAIDCGLCCVSLTGIGVTLLPHDAGLSAAIEPAPRDGPSLSWLTAPPLRPPRI